MKKSETSFFHDIGLKRKLLLKMKLTLIGLFLCLMQVSATVYSQATKFSFELRQTQVADVLKEIEQESNFRFFYQREQVNVERKVSINADNNTVEEILTALFKDEGIKYKVLENDLILLIPESEEFSALGDDWQSSVSGKVTDEIGQPLPGVTVVIKGTTQGTITDVDGSYIITNVPEDATLVFSFVGMRTQEVVIGTQETVNVTMEVDAIGIEEVVAIGYGTMRKSDMTGAVVSANMDAIRESPNTTVVESLRGNVPGLDIGQTVEAGEEPDLLIRGKSTLGGSQEPLIVLDGVIFRGSMNDINPHDIESVDILKDASAASVYGSQATNGVILITTTKGGKPGKPIIAYSGSYSFRSPVRELPGPDLEGFIKQTELSDITLSRTPESGYLESNPTWDISSIFSVNEEVEAYLDGRSTYWYDLLTNDNIHMQDHNISMSNSTQSTNYLVSLGYRDQSGYMINEGYSRISSRINLNNKITDWLEIGVQSFMSISDYSGAEADPRNRYIEPFATDKDAEGVRYRTILAGVVNPYIQMARDDFDQTLNLFGNLYAQIDIPFIKGLSYKINLANNYKRDRHYQYMNYAVDFQGRGQKDVRFRHDLAMDNIVTYKRLYNDIHNVQLTLLYGFEESKQDRTVAVGEVFINDVLGYNNLQVASSELQQAITGAWEEASLYSMARLFYGYKGKYMFTGTVRRDGYSGFGKENKIGVFPSLSVAWRASEESFLKDVDWLDNLKLRASYGTVGNRTIGRYQTLARVNGDFGFVNMAHSPLYTQSITSLESPNLKWEKTTGINLGIDYGVLSQRLYGSIDYYNNNTTDLFYKVDIPAISRYQQFPDNLGKLHNHGLEFSISSINMRRPDFEWSTIVSFARNRNELKELLGFDNDGDGKEDDLISEGLFIGESIDAIYHYEIDGKWQLDDEIPLGYDLGSYRTVDQDGDGAITPENDKIILGYSTPSYTVGIDNIIHYRDWTLRFFIHSIQGGKNYYLGRDDYTNFSIQNSETHYRYIFPEDVDFWTPENPNARYQRPDINTASGLAGRQYGDRSFIRLQNVSLSYELPTDLLEKVLLKRARIYFNGQNLLTFTKWNGWDPESNETITRDGRPVLKSFTLGLNVEF